MPKLSIEDLAGDGDHYRARIVAAAFMGLPRVRQHHLVYAALKGKMGGALHALAPETSAAGLTCWPRRSLALDQTLDLEEQYMTDTATEETAVQRIHRSRPSPITQ